MWYDRRFDPESLIEEESFRIELENLCTRSRASLSLRVVTAHNLIRGDVSEYESVYPFSDKPLAYNTFVQLIERSKVTSATPLTEEACHAVLEWLQRRCYLTARDNVATDSGQAPGASLRGRSHSAGPTLALPFLSSSAHLVMRDADPPPPKVHASKLWMHAKHSLEKIRTHCCALAH